jgi:hypothetical protein
MATRNIHKAVETKNDNSKAVAGGIGDVGFGEA